MTWAVVLTFAGVLLLGAMAPGPDLAIVIRSAAVSGRKLGMVTALGVATGVSGWAFGAATGIAALFAASALAYSAVKIVGAAYLVVLGVLSIRSATKKHRPDDTVTPPGAANGWKAYRQGLLCNLLNPKAGIFFVALMPQFLPSTPSLGSTLLLSLLASLVTGAWFLAVANIVGAVRRLLARPAVSRAIDGVTGVALLGLGVRLATSSRT